MRCPMTGWPRCSNIPRRLGLLDFSQQDHVFPANLLVFSPPCHGRVRRSVDGPAVLVGRVMLSAAVVCRHDFVQEDLVLTVDSPHFVIGEGHVLPPVV